jgi:hypothetical protein
MMVLFLLASVASVVSASSLPNAKDYNVSEVAKEKKKKTDAPKIQSDIFQKIIPKKTLTLFKRI